MALADFLSQLGDKIGNVPSQSWLALANGLTGTPNFAQGLAKGLTGFNDQFQTEQKHKALAAALGNATQGFTPQQQAFVGALQPEDAAPIVGQALFAKPSPPITRTRMDGPNEVQEQFNPATKTWEQYGQGPRFAPAQPGIPTGYRMKPDGMTLEAIPGGPAGMGQNDEYINALANYKVAPPSPRSPGRDTVIAAAMKVNPNYDEKRYNMANRALGSFTSGPQGNTVRSLNVSVAHLEALRDLGVALQNGDTQAFNSIAQEFAQQTGVAAPSNFDAAKSIVADEVAKGVIGGQTAQADREKLAESIRRSSSPAQIEGAITTFQRLLAGQLGGLRHQYETATGAKDFEQMLNPETRRVLERFPEGGGNTAPITQGGVQQEYVPGGPPVGSRISGPPPEAIAELKANPSTRAQFDQIFGPGAAAKVLGQ